MPKYPPNWNTIATDLKNKSGWVCAWCGKPHDHHPGNILTVHHLKGDTLNPDAPMVVLCQVCHLRDHGNGGFNSRRLELLGQLNFFDPSP